ncbi:MAG: Crp/Fnr family transcriptional regulator [Hydrogenophaga sp.]|jgi:CRP-like cAMP-binding protein|uniref:Crp/Fnr family transcriptional regulator n=1 Tax=Hydrogenophaga sp. TaxID=1904254 RepID=UPI002635B0C0|nr:Crp/Fnr family transcriptional regulator [Hydrogenophaga sp.]MDD3786856.1 Crp/Fnr family transcriptional regulator [Hydrogenophaga sp.]MDX9969861.1 Crp/Fnr family transcriptional regulator [Hydrogenophaga sp.]
MTSIKHESAWRGTADCRRCGIRDMVLFADLHDEDFNLIHAPIDDLEFQAGRSLVRLGETATSLYSLRSGMVKLVRNTVDGRQRIVRVLRPGDIIGLEALMGPVYESDAIALTAVKACRIPLQVIQRLDRETPRLHQRLLQKWHHSLREADDWLANLNFGNARQRVAGLILKMRSAHDQTVSTLFSREDMGAMLDLKLETVSRTLNAFIREGLIEAADRQGRVFRVVDEAGLR